MWRHKKLAGTKILVLDTWCQLDESGSLVDPDPAPDRIHKALRRHPDWKRPRGSSGPPGLKVPTRTPDPDGPDPDPGEGEVRPLPEEVSSLSNVKKLRELAQRLDIDLGDATRRADVEAAIAASDRTETQLVAVANTIAQE